MDKYVLERDGQLDFYKVFLPRINPALEIEDVLADNNDGVLNGNLLEFKLHVTDLNAVLFQCIKYLSALRVKGKPVPANILIVDVNAATVWLYRSVLYLADIEKLYFGGASRDNSGFLGNDAEKVFHYNKPLDVEGIVAVLKENNFTKIHIDENCIVGWATSFYRAVPTARKEDFLGDDTGKHKTIGEIRKPVHFAQYIYPYMGQTNVKFSYLMDKLNDTLQKKNLGAFYTHQLYAEKSLELVRFAIARVPAGNDYIILDRCAGTGNLEAGMTDDELSHCIVSTIEYYEYKVLQELLGAKVRHIIPPIETAETFNAGLVAGADALSKEYIENPIIKQYIDNPACTIILFENPPYAETTSAEHQRQGQSKASSTWKQSYAVVEMKKEVKGTASNDLGNAFIWSGFKYYLRQSTDSYIVYSPVKYWKAQHLIDRQFIKGFAYNRRHFHTNIDACIMCAYWSNEPSTDTEIGISAFDIEPASGRLVSCGTLSVKKMFSTYSQIYYDKRVIPKEQRIGILAGLNGIEKIGGKQRNKPATSSDIMGYMVAHSSGFDNPDLDSSLLVAARYDGNGFFLHKDNYLQKLPMFCASRYITYNKAWTERARIMKSADGADRYNADIANGKLTQFLLQCLLFTCTEMQNHMRTFIGSDGRFYRNELCLDGTNGETIALQDLKKLVSGDKEKFILKQWENILQWAKKADNYNPTLTYGIYQIYAELDTSHVDETTGNTIYDNIELHTALAGLKVLVKDYYNTEIVPVLFKYEFLK
ncbi:MAG: hypothetical protein NC420_14985 [Eubacterium sp.]|nr:hypothetical protein [Eubacterium sp.]MCM1411626.1 hypothetical protein [Lachnospiraceae bacterium]